MIVPLWLAISLRKSLLCTIQCPDWLTVPSLQSWLSDEKNNEAYSATPTFYYLEIGKLLFSHAIDDMLEAEIARRLLYAISEVRKRKTCRSLKDIHMDGDVIPGKMSHAELCQIRPVLYKSLKFMAEVRDTVEMQYRKIEE